MRQQPLDSHRSSPIPTESWGHVTDDWCKFPRVVFTMCLGGSYTKCFSCQCHRVCCVMVERTKNLFVMLNCKEHAFSHSTGSFSKNYWVGTMVDSRDTGQCCWEDRCHGKITSHGDTVPHWGKSGILPPNPHPLTWQHHRICDPESIATRWWRFC